MAQRGDTSHDVDDELLALLGLRKAPVKETTSPPATKPSAPMTFDELFTAVFGPQSRNTQPVEPAEPPARAGVIPDHDREFVRLFGSRASEVLGQDVEPIDAADPTPEHEWKKPAADLPMNAPSPEFEHGPGLLSPVAREQPPEHAHPAPAPPPQVPAKSDAPSRWKLALQIGSTVAAGGLVVLGVLAIRRRFAEIQQLPASEVPQARRELKAEIGKLREYAQGNPDAATVKNQIDRADKELDDLFAKIDRRHQRRA